MTERFALAVTAPPLPPRYNVAPQMHMPIIVGNSPNRLDIARWGLVPPWAKDERAGSRMINAQAETVAERPAYRAALRYHRCLVPASGFYEWQATPRGKQPYYVHLADEPLFAFAGLYETWHSPDGTELRTYTILTCEANAFLAPIYHRMPVILPREAESAWLDPRETRAAVVLPLLQPIAAEVMTAYPVSTAVNRRSNDSPTLLTPLSDGPPTPAGLHVRVRRRRHRPPRPRQQPEPQ
jgi:putative SOS response-associated peptidase YedK